MRSFRNPLAQPRPRACAIPFFARPQRAQRPRELAAGMAQPAAQARYDAVIIGGGGHGLPPLTTSRRNTASPTSPSWKKAGSAAAHRSQHDDRALELPSRAQRALLRVLAQALGGTVAGSQLQRDVQRARRAQPRASPADMDAACAAATRCGSTASTPNSCHASNRALDSQSRLLARTRAFHSGRPHAAPGWNGAPRRGRVGLCARRRRARRGHHPAMRSHGHPHENGAVAGVETTQGFIATPKVGLAVAGPLELCGGNGRPYAAIGSHCCRRWCLTRQADPRHRGHLGCRALLRKPIGQGRTGDGRRP